MTREGMVHALERIRRALTPQGILADLRPHRDRSAGRLPHVRVAAGGLETAVGEVGEVRADYREYRAAARASFGAVARGLYDLVGEDLFWLRYHFRTPEILERFLDERWTGAWLAEGTWRRLEALVRRTGGHVVVAEPMALLVMRRR